jgi:hypothetical protein
MKPQSPSTPTEWQEAVDLAEFLLLLDSAKQYGLIEGGPAINTARCADLLECGRGKGYIPAQHQVLLKRYMGDA